MRLTKARSNQTGPQFPRYRHMYATKRPTCRLMGPLKPFRACGIWSKDHPRARDNLASAHDPPKCARFGAKIMRSSMNKARSDAKPASTFADRALLEGRAACAPFFCAQFPARET